MTKERHTVPLNVKITPKDAEKLAEVRRARKADNVSQVTRNLIREAYDALGGFRNYGSYLWDLFAPEADPALVAEMPTGRLAIQVADLRVDERDEIPLTSWAIAEELQRFARGFPNA